MKTVLITGSTKGIGFEIAREFAWDGYRLLLNYAKDQEKAKEVENKFFAMYSCALHMIQHDLSDPSTVDSFIKKIDDIGMKEIDVLVLNAATTDYSEFGSISASDWNRVINTNLTVPFLLCQVLRDRIKKGGSIVFIGSILGIEPHARSVAYGVSKAGVHMLSKSLVKHFAKKQIRVNTIAPGFIDTDWQKNKPESLKDKISKKIAAGYFGNAANVAQLVLHIVKNKYINGEIIRIDGGYDFE